MLVYIIIYTNIINCIKVVINVNVEMVLFLKIFKLSADVTDTTIPIVIGLKQCEGASS